MRAVNRGLVGIGLLAACLLTGLAAVDASAAPSAAAGSAGTGSAVGAAPRHVEFSITSPLITESSSLEVSTVHPGLAYTANDSGGSATVYVLDASDGALVGQTSLIGVRPVDIEAMAIGADGTLVVGDVGDNSRARDAITAYRLLQPGRGHHSVLPDRVQLTYPGGPRDAESLLYDSRTGRLYVVSKQLGDAKVYRSRPHAFRRKHVRLQRCGPAPTLATDATFVDGYRYALVRSYFSAVVYRFPSWHQVTSFDLPLQPQGESVAALPGGRDVLIGSEGLRSKVLRFRLPDLSRTGRPAGAGGSDGRTVSVTRPTASAATSRHRERLRSIAGAVAGVAAFGLAMVLLTGLVLHRRRRRRATP